LSLSEMAQNVSVTIASKKQYKPAFFGSLVAGSVDNAGSEETMDMCPLYASMPKVSLLVGLPELKSKVSWSAAFTEFIWTGLVYFLHVGIGMWAYKADAFQSPLTAFAVGKALVLIIAIWGAASSGGHLNPNITFASFLTGHTTLCRTIMYWAGQFLGALSGITMARSAHGWSENDTNVKLHGCIVETNTDAQAFMYIMPSFFFFFGVIVATAYDSKRAAFFGPILAPIFIGVAYGLSIIGGINVFNSAECVGIAVTVNNTTGQEWMSVMMPMFTSVFFAIYYHITTNCEVPLLKRLA